MFEYTIRTAVESERDGHRKPKVASTTVCSAAMLRTKRPQTFPIGYCWVYLVSSSHQNASAVSALLDLSRALKDAGYSNKPQRRNFALAGFRNGIIACSDTARTTESFVHTVHTEVSVMTRSENSLSGTEESFYEQRPTLPLRGYSQ